MAKKDERFVKIYEQGMINNFRIYVDRETGVQYLMASVSSGGGVTPLIGPDGKPLLARIPVEDQRNPWA